MFSDSIVKQAITKARRTTVFALLGAALIVAGMLLERVAFLHQQSLATARLIDAFQAANAILLADERLTMSATLAAATGEARWIARYDANIPLIDDAIRRASALAPAAVAKRFDAETRIANDRLVAFERQSLEAVKAGQIRTAREILDGAAYAGQKRILSDGTGRFVSSIMTSMIHDLSRVTSHALIFLGLVILLSILGSLLLWRRLSVSLARSEQAFLGTEDRIRTLAMNDGLTEIYNRRALIDALRRAIGHAAHHGTKVAMLMIDLDDFKLINDRRGHAVGDHVLREVARRMADVLRAGEVLARYGGDEFVALVTFQEDSSIALHLAERLIDRLSEPITYEDGTLTVGASIGIAVYPEDADNDNELMGRADEALYRAKRGGKGVTCRHDQARREAGRALVQPDPSRTTLTANRQPNRRHPASSPLLDDEDYQDDCASRCGP